MSKIKTSNKTIDKLDKKVWNYYKQTTNYSKAVDMIADILDLEIVKIDMYKVVQAMILDLSLEEFLRLDSAILG